MAVASPILNFQRLSKTANLAKKGVATAGKSILNISQFIVRKTKIKRDIFDQTRTLKNRRVEYERRKQFEDELEAPDKVTKPGGAQELAQADTSNGFFDRLIGFVGYLTAGWLINNLPTWIGIGKEFIARLQRAGQILSGFFNGTIQLFVNFGNVLGALGQNIFTFDFFDTSNRLRSSFDELNSTVAGLGSQIEEAFGLVTTPLTQGKYSGQDIPGPNTQVTDEGSYNQQQYDASTYYSQGGEKIVDVGGKDYGDYGPGRIGSRGSSRVHGRRGEMGHTGEDYPMPVGTPLTMIAKGTVVDVGLGYNGGYGNFVAIQLDSGEYVRLAHLQSVNVKKGDRVGAGSGPNGTAKVVGFSGNSGLSTGAHLHLDYATNYNSASAMVSGTMDPASFINGGGLVKGKNVKSTGQVTRSSQPQQSMVPGTPAPSGGTLSTPQLVALAKQVGMTKNVNVSGYRGPLDVLMGAVAMQESRGKSTEMRTDTQVYGLWQIRWPVHASNLRKIGITSPEQLYDPLTNAKAAKMIYDSQGITAWSGFTDGRYKQFLPEAQRAAGIAPSQYQAQISAPPQQRISYFSAITPERRGQDIIIAQPPSQQNVIVNNAGGGDDGGGHQISEFDLLNNFIKNKLLLDLAYL